MFSSTMLLLAAFTAEPVESKVARNPEKAVSLWSIVPGSNYELHELKALKGHQGKVTKIRFSPNGELAVSVGIDKTMRLWNVSEGQDLQRFANQSLFLADALFSPDGTQIVTIDAKPLSKDTAFKENAIRLWDVASGKEIAKHALDSDSSYWPCSVAFATNGRYIVVGCSTGWIEVWQPKTNEILNRLRVHESQVTHLLITKSHKVISFGGGFRYIDAEKRFKVFERDPVRMSLSDIRADKVLWQFKSNDLRASAADLSSDGKRCLIAQDEDVAVVVDSESGKIVAPLKQKQGKVQFAKLSASGERAVVASVGDPIWAGGDYVCVLDMVGATEIERLSFRREEDEKTYEECVDISADGMRVITGNGKDGTIRVWSVTAK